jgi:hypothetical protein
VRKTLVRLLVASSLAGIAAFAASIAPGSGLGLGTAEAAAARPNTQMHLGPRGTVRSHTASFHLLGLNGAVRIQCRLDRGRWYVCARSSSKYVTLRNLRSGSHTFRARAVNRAGQVDLTPAIRTWRIR